MDIEAEIRDRSRWRSFVHLLRAAKLFIAKEACGATNSSMFPFKRPRSLAVKLRLALCTSSPISSFRTRTASVDCRICAFLEGQTVLTNSLKFPPLRYGRLYSRAMLAEYQALDTRLQAQNVDCVFSRRGMYERMWEIISEGRRTSRPECEEMKAGTVDCNSWVGL